jgi:hypothetical protein
MFRKVNPTAVIGDTNVAVRSPSPNHTPPETKNDLPAVTTLPIASVKDVPDIEAGKVSTVRPKPLGRIVAAWDTLMALASKANTKIDLFTLLPLLQIGENP